MSSVFPAGCRGPDDLAEANARNAESADSQTRAERESSGSTDVTHAAGQ